MLNDPECVHVRLHCNLCMQHNPEFLQACNDIGNGRLPAVDDERGPDDLHCACLDANMLHAVPDTTEDKDEGVDGAPKNTRVCAPDHVRATLLLQLCRRRQAQHHRVPNGMWSVHTIASLDQLSVFHLLACSASMCRSCHPFVHCSARMDSARNSSAIPWRTILDVCSCAAADAPEHCMEYFLRDKVVPIQGGMYADLEADVTPALANAGRLRWCHPRHQGDSRTLQAAL